MHRPFNNKAWLFIMPALCMVLISAGLPLMAVVNYTVQDVFPGNNHVWVGTEWLVDIIRSSEFHWALLRSLLYSCLILLVQIPLGIFIALRMPPKGALASFYIVLMCIPLLMPWIVVGLTWKILLNTDNGLIGAFLVWSGIGLDMNSKLVTWLVIVIMDSWHWTSLVVLLCYAGLMSIPEPYYQAARIDGASGWKIFRYIQLPKLKHVLLLAILLRFMDSFMVYAEPYMITRGGPDVATTFLSVELVQTALKQFDLGRASAMGLIYFLIMLTICWCLYTLMIKRETR